MKKLLITCETALLLFMVAASSFAADAAAKSPWEKFSFNAGVFASRSATEVRYGSGIGLEVNLEDALGMEADTQVFRVEGYWRFTKNRKHRAELSWFSLKRTAGKRITDDIVIKPPNEDEIVIEAGTDVESRYDMDIFLLNYSYSFIQDERLDFAGMAGLYLMPISFDLKVSGVVEDQGSQSFTAPLPALGLRIDILIAPKWYFRGSAQLFYIEYESYTGSLTSTRTAVEYNPWKHVGLGIGVDSLSMAIQADDPDTIPDFDLRGNVDFSYIGLYLYGRVFF